MINTGVVGLGSLRLVTVRQGLVWQAGSGQLGRGVSWHGVAWRGVVGSGRARLGWARLGRQGVSWRVMASRGETGPGVAGRARRGKAGSGKVGCGRAWHGRQGEARLGEVWPGSAGGVWLGASRHGPVRLGRHVMSTLRQELTEIYREHGRINAMLVVNAAHKNPDGYPSIYRHLEWDDAVAGERYRLQQAQDLIRRVKVVYKENPHTGERTKERAYVSTGANDRPSEYLTLEDAVEDPLTYQMILRQFQHQVIALRRRYGHLKEYEQIVRQHGLDGDAA